MKLFARTRRVTYGIDWTNLFTSIPPPLDDEKLPPTSSSPTPNGWNARLNTAQDRPKRRDDDTAANCLVSVHSDQVCHFWSAYGMYYYSNSSRPLIIEIFLQVRVGETVGPSDTPLFRRIFKEPILEEDMNC